MPSSVNRVYALAHPTRFNFGLNYTSSLVLPLQGFWNAVIYISTSMPACQALWQELRHRNSAAQSLRSQSNAALSLSHVRSLTDRKTSSDANSSSELKPSTDGR